MAEFSVIAYCVMMGLTLMYAIKKYRVVNVSVTCLSLYVISALTSIFFFYNSLYDYSGITVYSMIYVFICIMITMIPVFSYDNHSDKILYENKRTKKLVYITLCVLSIMAVEPFLENLIHIRSVTGNMDATADIYAARADGDNSKSEYLSWIGRKFFWINFLLRDIIPILFFYYILKWKKYNKYIIIGTSMAILNPIMHGFALGGRSSIVNTAFYFIFVYMVFRPYLSDKRKRIVDKSLLFMAGIVIAGIAALTIVRFASQEHSVDIWTWVTLYTGEGVLNFCSDLWPLSKTCNGDNTFLMVRYYLGLTNNTDIESVRATRDILGVRNLVFYTYLGTIYYDFNKIGTVLYCMFFSWFFFISCKPKNKTYRLSQLALLAILGKVIMMGVMFYPYTLWNDQLSLLLLLIYIVILKTKEKRLTTQ